MDTDQGMIGAAREEGCPTWIAFMDFNHRSVGAPLAFSFL
jgi:hypothetical protein